MSAARYIEPLDRAVIETLETMCFAEAVVAAAEVDTLQPLRTLVRFSGDDTGCLELRIGRNTARDLAAGFLGIDRTDLEADQITSVCKELTNMICGAMVSLSQPEGHFDLRSPEIRTGPDTDGDWTFVRMYTIDDAPVQIAVACAQRKQAGSPG
jgi:CheY-specific phosphatase CheX